MDDGRERTTINGKQRTAKFFTRGNLAPHGNQRKEAIRARDPLSRSTRTTQGPPKASQGHPPESAGRLESEQRRARQGGG